MEKLKSHTNQNLNLMQYQSKIPKENTMKTFKIAATVLAMSIASFNTSANTVTWSGNSATVSPTGCQFTNIANGSMERGQGSLINQATWTVPSGGRGSITVQSRNVSNITMTSDSILRDSNGNDMDITADVNYTGGIGSEILKRNSTRTINPESLAITEIPQNVGSTFVFRPGGSATMYHDSAVGSAQGDSKREALAALDNDVVYKINHTVTCTQ